MVSPIRPANRQNPPIKEPRTSAQAGQPKLRLGVPVPTAEFCRALRISPVSMGPHGQFSIQCRDGGVGRSVTAPGRQHFPVGEFT